MVNEHRLSKQLDWRMQVDDEPDVNPFTGYDDARLMTLRNVTLRNVETELSYTQLSKSYKLMDTEM